MVNKDHYTHMRKKSSKKQPAEVFYKKGWKMFLKTSQYLEETPALESFFNKIEGLRLATLC